MMMNLRENEPERDDSPQGDRQDINPYGHLPERDPEWEDRGQNDIREREHKENSTREQ